MKPPHYFRHIILAAALLMVSGSVPALAADNPKDIKVSPPVVEIGTFFNGSTVTVSGTIPADAEVVVEIVGPSAVEHLMRKGRRGGLWMNVGEISVENAPSLYLAASTDPQLLKAAPAAAPWGLAALSQRIQFSGSIEAGERGKFLDQFLQLKKSEHIYGTFPGAAKATPGSAGMKKVQVSFPLPTNVKPGSYEVCLSVVQQGAAAGKECRKLRVEMTGFPAMLFTMAYEHGTTYGILAVIIAIITGFAMGFLFKGGGGH
jgi:hypothetical protein